MILSLWAAVWLAQNPAPETSLWQYGVLGVFAFILLGVVKVLFARQEKLHEQALARADKAHEQAITQIGTSRDQAIARADKAEEELSKLNALIREQLVQQLTQTATALSRAADVLDPRYDERRTR